MEEVFRAVLASPVEPDGIDFDGAELQVTEMREGVAYPGVRVRVVVRLGIARIRCQVDVGFGDVVVDPPAKTELPTLLDLPAPSSCGSLRAYPVHPPNDNACRGRSCCAGSAMDTPNLW